MDRLENLKNIIMYLMADEHVSHQIPSSLEVRQRDDAGTDERMGTSPDSRRLSDEAGCRVADAARGQRGGRIP